MTVYDGIDPDAFVCRDCPIRASGPLDATSWQALAVWNALTPLPEGSASVETVFRLMDIPFPSPLATELYRRICLIGSTMQAHSEQRQAQHQTTHKPGQAGTEDLLAGLVDDDDED